MVKVLFCIIYAACGLLPPSAFIEYLITSTESSVVGANDITQHPIEAAKLNMAILFTLMDLISCNNLIAQI